MKNSTTSFRSAKRLADKIDEYFAHIKGEHHIDKKNAGNKAEEKIWDREPEPATIAGLALFLGFDSIQAFMEYEEKGRFARSLKRGRLRVESVYEKKLHLQSSAGAIFALKSMGWDNKNEETPGFSVSSKLKVEVVTSGPQLAASEHEVTL